MAFHLTPEEHKKVGDEWKPSYTAEQYRAFCYLLEHAEGGIPLELGPLERYSPENLYEPISEVRFLTAVQIAVADYAQDSHRGRDIGPEFTTPNFWNNIPTVLGYPSQYFWTDLQVTISDLQRVAWRTSARLYDINDKPTPEEEEKYKKIREEAQRIREESKAKLGQTKTLSTEEFIEQYRVKREEQEKAVSELLTSIEKNTEKLYQHQQHQHQELQQLQKPKLSWLERITGHY